MIQTQQNRQPTCLAAIALLLLFLVLLPEFASASVTTITCASTITITSTNNGKQLQILNCGATNPALTVQTTSNIVLTVTNTALASINLVGNTNLTLQLIDCSNKEVVVGRPFLSINGSESLLSLLVDNANIITTVASAIYSGPTTTATIRCQSCSITIARSQIRTLLRAVVYFSQLRNSNVTFTESVITNTFAAVASRPQERCIVVENATASSVRLYSTSLDLRGSADTNLQVKLSLMTFPSWTSGLVEVVQSNIAVTAYISQNAKNTFTTSLLGGNFTNATVAVDSSTFATTAVSDPTKPQNSVSYLNFFAHIFAELTLLGLSELNLTSTLASVSTTGWCELKRSGVFGSAQEQIQGACIF